MSAETRLKELGIELPQVAPIPPGFNIVRTKRIGSLLFVSGAGPAPDKDGKRPAGKVGRDLTLEEGYQAARLAGLNLLSQMREAVGSLDRVKQIIKVLGAVNCAPGFNQTSQVMHGCSDLFVEVFGEEAGRHTRTALGVSELPLDFPVEIEIIAEVE